MCAGSLGRVDVFSCEFRNSALSVKLLVCGFCRVWLLKRWSADVVVWLLPDSFLRLRVRMSKGVSAEMGGNVYWIIRTC